MTAPGGEERGAVAEAGSEQHGEVRDPSAAERDEHPDSFDPGTETGFIRRGARRHELEPELGASPFDPGSGRYDSRRAKRAERRRAKAERKRRAKAERRARKEGRPVEEQRRERSQALRDRLAGEQAERQAEAAAEQARAERAQRERVEAELTRLADDRQAKAERAEVQRRRREGRERRDAAEGEHKAEKRRVRAERDASEQQRRIERQRERRRREEWDRVVIERVKGRRSEREQQRSEPSRRPGRPMPEPAAEAAAGAGALAAAASKAPPKAQPAASRGKPPQGPPSPRRRKPPQQASLRRPTVKVVIALAMVAGVAAAAGALLGLPLPLVADSDGPDAATAGGASLTSIDPGTPKGLTRGPYHPVVVSNPNYAEAAAKFGADRGGRRHEGQDVFARPGTPLVAVRDGVVLDGGGGKSFYSYGGGNTFVMYSPLDDRSYIYLHMKRPALVKAGERVKAGQLIGFLGCTGSCDGPHLHFEVRRGRAVFGPQKKAIDPLPLLKQWRVRPPD